MDLQVIRLCRLRLENHYAPKVEACLQSLDAVDIHQPTSAGHSIEGLVNHILAHLQMAAAWAANDPGHSSQIPRDISTFFPEANATASDLTNVSNETFARVCHALRAMEGGTSQSPDLDTQRLLHLVEHVSYHLGQLVLLAKQTTRKDFAFVQSGLNEAQLRQLEANESQQA